MTLFYVIFRLTERIRDVFKRRGFAEVLNGKNRPENSLQTNTLT